jgi:1-acyl-sn-glycerol-3-phosphate acyltransferase
MGLIGRAVSKATVWSSGIFYRIERVGGDLPEGPVFIVTNHPNMLMDPLLSMKAARRRVRILAKAPLFEIPIFGSVLRSLDTLPLYRVQDDPEQLHRNKLAFQEAVDSLAAGHALLTFPEGKSHSAPALAPLKTGVARMTLAAEEASDWRLGVRIVPIGLAYKRKHRFRSRVVVGIGDPIPVADWRAAYESDRAAAVRSLNRAIGAGLSRQTLNLSQEAHRELVETADLLYSRARGKTSWRERESMLSRLPRLQKFAESFASLEACDPERWDRLASQLRRYRGLLERLGSGDADVPPGYERGRVIRYVSREAIRLGLTLPLAAAGTFAWYLPYFLSGLVSRIMRPPIETVATVKLLTGVVVYPAMYVVWIGVAAAFAGWLGAIIAGAATPMLGLIALRWWQRREEVAEDVRLFFQVVRRPGLRDRLAERRNAIVAELDEILGEPGGNDERAR